MKASLTRSRESVVQTLPIEASIVGDEAAVHHRRVVGGERAGDLDAHQRVGDGVAGEGVPAQLGPLVVDVRDHVRDGLLERAVGADGDAFEVERAGDDVPAAVLLADERVGGDADVLPEGLVGAALAHHPQRADGDAGRVERQHEGRDAAVLGRLGLGARGEPDVRREVGGRGVDLLAVDHPLVAVADGARLERGEVGAGVGLGVAEGEVDVAGEHLGEELLLLLLGAVAHDHGADGDEGEVVEGDALAGALLGEGPEEEGALALAAVLLGPSDGGEALAGHGLHELAGGGAVAVDVVLGDLGVEFRGAVRGDEVPHLLAEVEHLRGHLEVHVALPPVRRERRGAARGRSMRERGGTARGERGSDSHPLSRPRERVGVRSDSASSLIASSTHLAPAGPSPRPLPSGCRIPGRSRAAMLKGNGQGWCDAAAVPRHGAVRDGRAGRRRGRGRARGNAGRRRGLRGADRSHRRGRGAARRVRRLRRAARAPRRAARARPHDRGRSQRGAGRRSQHRLRARPRAPARRGRAGRSAARRPHRHARPRSLSVGTRSSARAGACGWTAASGAIAPNRRTGPCPLPPEAAGWTCHASASLRKVPMRSSTCGCGSMCAGASGSPAARTRASGRRRSVGW